MQKVFTCAVLALFFALASLGAQAQTLKIGYTNPARVLPLMADFDVAKKDLESYAKLLEKQATSKQEELQTKFQRYQEEASDLPPIVRQEREKELNQLNQSLQEFQQKAEQDLMQKEQKLLEPIYGKIAKAIEEVAKEGNYTLILNEMDGTRSSVVLYASESIDITEKVAVKLGIDPAKLKEAAAAQEAATGGNE